MMRLVYMHANCAWVFLTGTSAYPDRLDGEPMFFDRRKDAVAAARRKGLCVGRNGAVSVAKVAS